MFSVLSKGGYLLPDPVQAGFVWGEGRGEVGYLVRAPTCHSLDWQDLVSSRRWGGMGYLIYCGKDGAPWLVQPRNVNGRLSCTILTSMGFRKVSAKNKIAEKYQQEIKFPRWEPLPVTLRLEIRPMILESQPKKKEVVHET